MALVRRPLSWLVLFLAVFFALQSFSFVALVFLARIKHITYAPMAADSFTRQQRLMLENFLAGRWDEPVVYSSVLGWTANPNVPAPRFRLSARKVFRIAAFGDFVFGDGVKDEDSWQNMMMRAHRNVEVLDFGVDDSGIDQTFLRYEEVGAAYKADVVVIGFFADEIALSVNVYRPFYNADTHLPLAKPRYALQNGKLVLLPNPLPTLRQYSDLLSHPARVLPELGRYDFFYQSAYHRGPLTVLPSVRLYQILRNRLAQRRPAAAIEKNGVYNVDSEAFKVTAAVFDEFVDRVRRAGSVPVIVVLPRAWDIQQYRREGIKQQAPLLEHFQARGYRYVDMVESFEQYGATIAATNLAPNQYARMCNDLVTRRLWRYLVAEGLTEAKNRSPR